MAMILSMIGTKRKRLDIYKKMKTTKKLIKLLIFLLPLLLMHSFSVTAYADMGDKPSVDLTIINPPEGEYYVGLLQYTSREDNLEGLTNSPLTVNYSNQEEIEEYLENFYYDGWYFFDYPETWMNSLKSNERHKYSFDYWAPSYFRAVVIDKYGNVTISEPCDAVEYHCYATMDYSTGELLEDTTTQLRNRILSTIRNVMFTYIIEGLVLVFMFKYPLTKGNILAFIIANGVTQFFLNRLMYFKPIRLGMAMLLALAIMEIIIWVGEGIFYGFVLRCKDGYGNFLKSFGYGIVANLLSMFGGFIIIGIGYYILAGIR